MKNVICGKMSFHFIVSVMVMTALWSRVIAGTTRNTPSMYNGRFLHITDIHLDPLYGTGATPYYCHGNRKTLGVYGDRACDSPPSLVKGTFETLKKVHAKHPFDFIIWSGDSNRYSVWFSKMIQRSYL